MDGCCNAVLFWNIAQPFQNTHATLANTPQHVASQSFKLNYLVYIIVGRIVIHNFPDLNILTNFIVELVCLLAKLLYSGIITWKGLVSCW